MFTAAVAIAALLRRGSRCYQSGCVSSLRGISIVLVQPQARALVHSQLVHAVMCVDRSDQSHTLAADDAARRFGTEEPAEHTNTTRAKLRSSPGRPQLADRTRWAL
jgi:hypothetical protein